MAVEDLDIVGEWPELAGKPLNQLIAQESWFEGERDDEANVVWLDVDGTWYRLYFDGDAVFWRVTSRAPELDGEDGDDFQKVDLSAAHGLSGLQITACEGNWVDDSSQVTLRFEGGRAITFRNRFDTTTVLVDPTS